ncbi:response regulator transcription factor [Clostridium sp. D2Q-11]|uniref:Transcriptional regulatory protein WalR n=1 Tax=Anaeromonas frigoriresistens TaxID=2683708 RepID=A0A942UY71_9FIRM|nr:response regulator YycF [Anaeromonas frigoriresistens]MBS4538501.1 response regulator transcription factor [Anaeromonas frigoriresistens]
MAKKILVVDDEKPIADILRFNLQKEGYDVSLAHDGEEAVKIAMEWDPDLILLDIMLPKKDGFEVLKEIREKKDTPVIMLTAKEEEVDKILGLEMGADDYITKPFSIRELSARVKANIRRGEMVKNVSEKEPRNIIKSGNLEIDLNKYEVIKNGVVIDLTLREFELLRFISTKPEQVFSREKLLQEVWGYEYYGDIRTVDVTIRRLREKIEDNSSNPQYVITKRGVGYYFRRA